MQPDSRRYVSRSLVYRSKRFDRLYLENNLPTNEEIDSIAAIQFHVFVDKRNRLLPFEGDLSNDKLAGKTFFVSRLDQSWSKSAMHLDGRSDNCMRQLVVGHVHRRGAEYAENTVPASSELPKM